MAFAQNIKFDTIDLDNYIQEVERNINRRVQVDPIAGDDGSSTTQAAYFEGAEYILRGAVADPSDAQALMTPIIKALALGKKALQFRDNRTTTAQATQVGWRYKMGAGFSRLESVEITLQADEPGFLLNSGTPLTDSTLPASGQTSTDTLTNTGAELDVPFVLRLTSNAGTPGASNEYPAGNYLFYNTTDGNKVFMLNLPASSGIGYTHYLEVDTSAHTIKRYTMAGGSPEDWSDKFSGEEWKILGKTTTSTGVTIQHPSGIDSANANAKFSWTWTPRVWSE